MSELDKLENLLVNNSNVDKECITNFLKIQKKKVYNKYKPFTIDLKDISYLLELKETKLRKILNKNYLVNTDYISIKNPSKDDQHTKRNGDDKILLLTQECFKMICLGAKSKKADMIRDYYLIVEKIVSKLANSMNGGGKKEYIIDNKKINAELKIMFSEISETVMWNVYEKPKLAYYNGKIITDKKLNEIIIHTSYINNILIVPCQRDSEFYDTINLGRDSISYKKLFNILYKFYKEPIDINYLKKIPNDVSDHISDAIKKIKHKSVSRIDLIGNLCRFERIKKVYENIYILVMGS